MRVHEVLGRLPMDAMVAVEVDEAEFSGTLEPRRALTPAQLRSRAKRREAANARVKDTITTAVIKVSAAKRKAASTE
ncbi:MAG: hypothetical protein NVS2B16_26840 [Chloroflexota bacterium]